MRRSSSANTWRLQELGITNDIRLVDFDLCELGNIVRVLEKIGPEEVYDLAAQSFVATSFEQPLYTSETREFGTARLLEALRVVQAKNTRFYQASSSEMFGNVEETPQSESTPFRPRSPYAIAKLYAHWMTVHYREAYGMHASSGILFNHESPLRGVLFVTRKITLGLAKLRYSQLDVLRLGNLDAERD